MQNKFWNAEYLCEFSGLHGGENSGLWRRIVFWYDSKASEVNATSVFSRWQHGPLTSWYPTTTSHGITIQKSSIWNLIQGAAEKRAIIETNSDAIFIIDRFSAALCTCGRTSWTVELSIANSLSIHENTVQKNVDILPHFERNSITRYRCSN